eukprot:CAMPEP_0201869818 /NCGR_PEP_ID=MMETSP0902-20130614/3190_1 /ASSEMBLY_ACC=CAM_ASM_000551 /TAXON_ID=420261 /ORGANISM="Thalassiosira antarctica, Strain CCMP982" /LENGTH=484 /DNA_ID=CAMNT_0048395373 /DNA_START=33 /DNA_END=1487 /DNA_ORIENTATION=+
MMMQLPIPTPVASSGATAFPSTPALTSTTAPGKIFNSRSELQQHYKSDWHRYNYNLKRREAGLPMLIESDFTLRLEAAVALRKEREGREERSGMDHHKDKSKTKKDKKKQKKQQGKSHGRKPAFATNRKEGENLNDDMEDDEDAMQKEEPVETTQDVANDDASMEEGPPEINPSQSLFDNHVSPTPQANLEYLQSTYSFYLPDPEYCVDVEGFLGYCNEKVRWGNLCLCCQKSFASGEAVLKHMKDKRHCKILYERGVDQEEFDVFYDFSPLREFLGAGDEAMEEGDGGDEGWEDTEEEGGEDDDMYDAYQSELATKGFDITPLGELIFPDGRIIGHRGLARYYKQRFAPDRTEQTAVRHAKEAAGDRLYQGRVVNMYRQYDGMEEESGRGTEGGRSGMALASMGRIGGSIPVGRNGRGILVAGEGKGGFTALSLYRYRATVKKQRREEKQGQRLAYRQTMNMNKMGKKANNITTGVVTAALMR